MFFFFYARQIRAVKVAAVQPAAAEVGLVGSISLVGAAPVVKSVEKDIVASVPVAPVAPIVPVQDTVAINTVTTVGEQSLYSLLAFYIFEHYFMKHSFPR